MKFITASLMILLLASQAFSKWVMLLEFELNRDYIANNLCENRIRPKLKCGGKCQLMKAMEAEEKENSSSQTVTSKFHEIPFSVVSYVFTNCQSDEGEPSNGSQYLVKDYTSPTFPIFHPPA